MVSMCSGLVIQKEPQFPLSEEELEDKVLISTRVAFSSRHLCEEIEGGVLYEEKHHKEKTKTGASALVVCLNIDIDPPDVQKIPPYSKVEAWFDPTDANSLRALEVIGRNLQAQYERWQPRARFKQCLDPTLEDVKNLTISLRRNVKGDRILFHYNGHGVPRPTENGEIWVFNTKFTKYIPLSLYDLQRWLGAPSVYVFDCQNAGRVIRMYETFCRRRMAESLAAAQRQQQADTSDGRGSTNPGDAVRNGPIPTNLDLPTGLPQVQPPGPTPGHPHPVINPPVTMENTIMLAACREDEDLPQNPELPADLFTACLTTPIRMALRWHWLRHQESFPGYLDEALLDRIPGAHSNRMSLLGEVNWIFTAVTDTIAWCSFPIDLFQKLFRQDLLVAGLFRNFLLAERIMKTYGCTPVSAPALPPTFRHSMWNAWDHTLDRLVHYLPRMLKVLEGTPTTELKLPIILPAQSNGQPQQSSGVAHFGQIPMVTSPAPPTAVGMSDQQHMIDATMNHRLNQLTGRSTTPGATLPAHGRATAVRTGAEDPTSRQQHRGQAPLTNRVVADPERKTYSEMIGKLDQLQSRPQVPARPELQRLDKSTVIVPPGFSTNQKQEHQQQVAPQPSAQRPLPRHPGTGVVDEVRQQVVPQPNGGRPRHTQEGRVRHPTRNPSLTETHPDLPAPMDTMVHLGEGGEPSKIKERSATADKGGSQAQQAASDSQNTSTVDNDEDDSDVDVDEDELDEDESDSDDESDDSYEVQRENDTRGPSRSCGAAGDKTLPHTKPTESAPSKLVKEPTHTVAEAPPTEQVTKQDVIEAKPPSTMVVSQTTAPTHTEYPQQVKLDAEKLKQLVQYSTAQTDGHAHHQRTVQVQPPSQAPPATATGGTQVVPNVSHAQPNGTKPTESTLTALRRQQHVLQELYTLQSQTGNHPAPAPVPLNPTIPPVVCPPHPIATPVHAVPTTNAAPSPLQHHPPTTQQQQMPPGAAPGSSNPPVYAGSVIGGSGPASFFTSQMTAFKVWLQTADEKQPPAMQLPILLQILLSQSHRTRAMQLLSEFLDLGPWAVTHCLMVGILPYIARLFSSNLSEVKPHLVFIWGKIIASAQTEFSRSDSVRDGGYKYFMNCLNDTENLSPLTRTITAFALTKMLEKEPFGEPDVFFQAASLKQNFLPLVLSQLSENPPTQERELLIRMRLWLIFALSKLWRRHDEARWFGIRYNVTEVLFSYLDDVSPEVRAATTYALGTLVDNQTTDACKQDHADQISQQVVTRLVKLATLEASPLVRCELVAALCPLVRQFESQLCAMAHQYLQELQQLSSSAAVVTPARPTGRPTRQSVTGFPPAIYFSGRPEDACTPPKPIGLREDGPLPSTKTKRSDSLVLSTFFAGTTNVYAQFWLALVQLSNDPYPKVSQMARRIMNYLLARVSERFGVPLVAASPSPPSVPVTKHLEQQTASTPASSTTPPPEHSPAQQAYKPTQDAHQSSFSNESSPPNPVERASGPAPTLTKNNSPMGHPNMSHSMCSSPTDATFNYLTQRRSTRVNVPLTSTFLLHSAQFTGRRHHQVDQLVRKPVLEAQSSYPAAQVHSTPEYTPLSDQDSPLGIVQKTQFFAWSCRWFTQPLLAKYGQTRPLREEPTRSPLSSVPSTSSLMSSKALASSPATLNELYLRERQQSGAPDPELASLCAVSVDSEAVAYADRLTRLTQQRESLSIGRKRWLDAIGPGSPADPSLVPAGDDGSPYRGHLAQLAHSRSGLSTPTLIRFHPHQPHLVVADRCGMAVCSSQTLSRLNYLPTPAGFDLLSRTAIGANKSESSAFVSRITDVQFINCSEERGLLLSAHEDGRVRIWRNYLRDLGQDAEVVTAWVGLSELLPSSNPAGVVSHWSQYSQQLALGGDSKVIRLWDCERESRVRDIPTGADACVTSLVRSVDQSLLCAGFGDGGVRVFDLRIPVPESAHHSNDCHVFSGQGDSGWIHAVAFGPSGRLYSTGSSGGVSSWQLTAKIPKFRPRTSNRSLTSPGLVRQSSKLDQELRFERRPYPPRLSIPTNSLVHCAALKVDLPPLSSHLVIAGIGGSAPQLLVHRIQGGSVHSSLTHIGREKIPAPVSIAVHPVEPMIAAGLKDKSVVLLLLETRRTSSRVSQVLGLQS